MKIVKLLKYYTIDISDWVIKPHWGRQMVLQRGVSATKHIILILSSDQIESLLRM